MTGRPLVSIVTVCLNSEDTISDTLESVLRQDYSPIEYCIVDGGSNDNTKKIIEEYESRFEGRMRWTSGPDKGIFDAMNKGIEMARGDIIGIINADDWYESDAVSKIVSAFQRSREQLCMVTGRICLCDRNGKRFYYVDSREANTETIVSGMPVNHPATFVAAKVYSRIGLYDTSFKISADYDFIFRALKAGISVIDTGLEISNMRVGGISEVGKGYDLLKARENFRVRRKNGIYQGAYVIFAKDLVMALYRRMKRCMFGRFFVLKRFYIE